MNVYTCNNVMLCVSTYAYYVGLYVQTNSYLNYICIDNIYINYICIGNSNINLYSSLMLQPCSHLYRN